uniref:Uncharacterized protein n=1 Tax=Pseudo-nitzschia australis TaxID=44445 RepID=A0A7S4EJG2_9STRA
MNELHRLWTIMCILGASSILEFSTATSSHDVRADFVQAMDRALGQKKNDEIFRSRLQQLAIPAKSHPGYMRSQQLNYDIEGHRHLEEYQDYAIDLSEYALKYIGCSNIRTWSDELAAENNNGGSDSVLKMNKFVVLRLCPRDSCSNYNQYGCLQLFGDYLIPMETYLQTMAETFFAQYQEYCETCYECMANRNDDSNDDSNDDGANYNNYNNDDAANYNNNNNYYNNNYNNYNNDDGNYNGGRRLNDDAWYNYNNYVADDAAGGDDDYYKNQVNYNNNENQNQDGDCEYYSVCASYQTACQDYSNLGFDLEDYFACAEFNIGNSAGYLGPHCANDGKTISMGIFNDEYCNDYSADLSEVSSYMASSENGLEAYYSNNCISCLASDGYTLEVGNNDDYNAVSDICGALYGESAKCNRYMGNDGYYASTNQESQENTVCNFIENLLTNSYDEYGEIVLQEVGWKTYIPNMNTISKMPQWQKYALSVSILSSVGMFIYACHLYREIKRQRYTWYPRGRKGYSTGYPGVEPTSMDGRMHSGIIQGRSHSSGNFEMKDGGMMS